MQSERKSIGFSKSSEIKYVTAKIEYHRQCRHNFCSGKWNQWNLNHIKKLLRKTVKTCMQAMSYLKLLLWLNVKRKGKVFMRQRNLGCIVCLIAYLGWKKISGEVQGFDLLFKNCWDSNQSMFEGYGKLHPFRWIVQRL